MALTGSSGALCERVDKGEVFRLGYTYSKHLILNYFSHSVAEVV